MFIPLLTVALWALCRALRWGVSEANIAVQILTYCGALFACCMVCHGELVRLRPPARRLTGFYLAVSAGGALGGLFVSVVAPMVFPDYFELHATLFACAVLTVAALLVDPGSPFHLGRGRELRAAGPASPLPVNAVPAGRVYRLWYAQSRGRDWGWLRVGSAVVGLAAMMVGTAALGRSLRADVRETLGGHPSTRNFYGVLRVYEEEAGDGTLRRLQHGGILHGAQFADGDRRDDPITYYCRSSGVGLAMCVLHERPKVRVGVVGLGVGTMAAYGRAGDSIRFYEIDPAVRDVATNRFSYLGRSKAEVLVALGDARLSLEREASQQFDLLALDAFSSDSIPVHLLTREALQVYAGHLRPDGILAVHVSNRHLDLAPVVHRLAGECGFHTAWIDDVPADEDEEGDGACDVSEWILLARDVRVLDAPAIRRVAQPPPAAAADVRPWTDDDTNLYQVLRPMETSFTDVLKRLKFW